MTFRLWAPDGHDIALEIMNRPLLPMKSVGGGWLEALVDCGPGTHYRFRLGDTVFPDPASRLQAGGVHGWSVVMPPRRAKCWPGRVWEDSVFYECHAGLMGGFAGISAQLPRLADLGITVLELMPIAAFPGARNWGYDGVLPFAPAEAYGTPDALSGMIEKAHQLRLSVVLDVVYNHFGPDGNYLPLYAGRFFRDDVHTPWGSAIDFREAEVCAFFFENAAYWLEAFGFDGLRLDAVHAIRHEGWLTELQGGLHARLPDRPIKLIIENEDNDASLLESGFDAQWNDDIHHALHVLLTGETHAYYGDFRERPAEKLARALSQGFIYQGEVSPMRGAPRGTPSTHLPPTAFVSFLQNHDQTGNRALGERLTSLTSVPKLRAAIALLILCPQIPMLFMGEEKGTTAPFLYFTDHGPELAEQVRAGRKREFAHFAQHGDIPDPNSPDSFLRSRPAGEGEDWFRFYQNLIALRAQHIVPGLKGIRSLAAEAISERAVRAVWRLGDGSRLTVATNLADDGVGCRPPAVDPFFGDVGGRDRLAPCSTVAWIEA